MRRLSPGLLLLTLAQLIVFPGSFLADYNETHVKNPRWPPHARFHNGQTMTLSLLLSGTAIYYAWKGQNQTKGAGSGVSGGQRARDLWTAAWVGSFYCVAGLSAIWYPGTAWMDVEFRRDRAVDEAKQLGLFTTQVVLTWLGYWLEVRKEMGWDTVVRGKGI